MPSEKITATTIYNGGEDIKTNVLKIQWGVKGDAPEAPKGWVNAGFAFVEISDGDAYHHVELDADEIDHLIRTLKRIRRQAFRVERMKIQADTMTIEEANETFGLPRVNGVNIESRGGEGVTVQTAIWGGDITSAVAEACAIQDRNRGHEFGLR